MSNVSRGADLERRTVAWLQSCGYRAERVSRGGRYGGDLFQCIDVVAVSQAGDVELIQVTTKSAASARRKKIRDAALGVPVRLFVWFKNGVRWDFKSEEVV